MDNLTHSALGLAIGELIHRASAAEPDPARQRTRRRLLLVSAWAASNFPDLDLLLTGLLPAPLGYLLHHRGHTHTLLYLLPQAALLVALLWLLWPGARALLRQSRSARRGLALAVGLGLLFHIVMDGLNSYGVHPFHPVDSRWLYGDMVFILEPVFWVALGVPLAMTAPSVPVRALLLGLLTAILVWAGAAAYLHWVSTAVLLLLGAGLGWLQVRAGLHGRAAIAAGFAAALAYIGVQASASAAGKALVRAQAGSAIEVLDVVMNGYPANPLCWQFITVEKGPDRARYSLGRGVLSVAPALLPVSACPAAFAPAVVRAAPGTGMYQLWRSDHSLAALRERAANCHVKAWLRFARVPALHDTHATDARFGRSDEGSNFSTLPFADFAARPCPSGVPAWDMPRADLLSDQ